MKKIKILGWDCHVALTLSALLAMTTMWACDGTEDGHPDADACCDADVPTDQDGGEVEHCAALEVSSIPAGAAIELDGEPTGKTTPAVLNNVPIGVHTFTLALDGYDAAPEEVNITTECGPVNITLYPSVEGEWDATFRNSTGGEGHYNIHFDQDGELVTGYDDMCEYSGSITTSGYISLFVGECGGPTLTMTGNLVSPTRLEGDWYSSESDLGTWWADQR